MGVIVVVLLAALLLAAAVIVYAAFPYRGEATPISPSLGRVMRRGVLRLPTIDASPAAEQERERELTRTR